MTKITTAANLELMMTYYDNVFLERFNELLVLDRWTDKKNIPLWRGKTVNYFAYYPLSGTATAITEGASTANEATVAGQTLEATIAKYAQWAPYTERVKLTARDPNVRGAVELFGEAAAKSLELLLARELAQKGSIPIRVDDLVNDTTYTIESTVDASTAGNTTQRIYDAALNDATGTWNGGHFAVLHNATRNYRFGAMVSHFSSTGDYLYLDTAADRTFTANTTYRLVVGTGLAAANKITGTAINYAVSKARTNKFYTFPGGFFNSALAPEVEYDLQGDPVYRNLAVYQQAGKIEQGYIGNLWGVRFHRCTMPYRETVAGTYSASGVVFSTPIVGRHALGNVSLGGMKEHKIMIKTPGPQTTNEPYDENGTIGYKFYAAVKSLNAAFAINLMSGASGVS